MTIEGMVSSASVSPLTQAMDTSSHDMPAMSSVFSTETKVTIFFTEWTTNSPASYAATVISFFLIAIFNRFLGALKVQLDRYWSNEESQGRSLQSPAEEIPNRKRWSWKKVIHSNLADLDKDDDEKEPLSPTLNGGGGHIGHGDVGFNTEVISREDSSTRSIPRPRRRTPRFWKASGPWRWQEDGPRALLESARAMIGYLL